MVLVGSLPRWLPPVPTSGFREGQGEAQAGSQNWQINRGTWSGGYERSSKSAGLNIFATWEPRVLRTI